MGAIVHRVAVFWGLPARHPYIWAALIGGLAGALAVLAPLLAGGGDQVIENKLQVPPELIVLIVLALARALLLVAGYSSGVPGGIFAPMLSIGVAIGLAYGGAVALVLPGLGLHPGLFGVAAMGALFAAMVRAPLTGIVVVLEMTGNIELTFAIMITTLAATFTAEALGGRPIYAQLGKTA